MVELKKKDIESANKRSLRRYIRNAYEASTDSEEEGNDLKKAYIIQLLIGINVVHASIADERETTLNAQDEDANKNEGSTAKTIVGDVNE